MQIKITETLTQEARRARFIAEGREPPGKHEFTLDAEQFAPEVREAMLRCVEAHYSWHVRERGDGATGARSVSPAPGCGGMRLRPVEVTEYGRTEGVAERILAAAAYAPEARAEDEAAEAAKAVKAAEQAARDEEARVRRREVEEAKEAAREAAKAARQAAKLEWIASHGSERLRLAVDLVGIDKVNGIYVDERVAHLHAVSGLQWERDVEESSHDEPLNPSLEALRLCLRVRESAAEWGLACATPDDQPELVFVRNGGLYSEEICVVALLDGMRVLVAPR